MLRVCLDVDWYLNGWYVGTTHPCIEADGGPPVSIGHVGGAGRGAQNTHSCPLASPLSLDDAPVLFWDDDGDPVLDNNNSPMLRPEGWDPHFFTQQGAMLGTFAIGALPNFRIGGKWDAQRMGGTYHQEFVDAANVNIGLFASAAGIDEQALLTVANAYASKKSRFGQQPMDPTYTSLRQRNVYDMEKGYDLQRSGAICTRK